MSLQNNELDVHEESNSEDECACDNCEDEYADNDYEEQTISDSEDDGSFLDEPELLDHPNNSYEDDDEENHYEEGSESECECEHECELERELDFEDEDEDVSLNNADECSESSSEEECESADEEEPTVDVDITSAPGVSRVCINGEVIWIMDRTAFNDFREFWAREQSRAGDHNITREAASNHLIQRTSAERRRASLENFRQGITRRRRLIKVRKVEA